ncbi:MAG: SDR family oxidoreductase [Pseudomonadota bacterium]
MGMQGKVAVITGSAVGVGRGLALTLSAEGAAVAGLDIDVVNNHETGTLVRADGGAYLAVDCDIADKVQVRRAINQVLDRFERIDLLINNAAVFEDSTLLTGTYESQTEAYERSMNTCALGAFFCAHACVPALLAAGGGNIINIITEHIDKGSYLTRLPALGYDCAKFALWRQVETWAYQLRETNLRVNGLAFGATDTPLLRGFAPDRADAAMKPADIGQAILNVLAHGEGGPTGQVWRFGYTGTPREESLTAIAAIAPGA